MMTCTFFGHKNTPDSIKPLLEETLTDLIENHGADKFYVGDSGSFDRMAAAVLQKLKEKYPHIKYCVVLAYLPNDGIQLPYPTEFPEGIENIMSRLAINYRNKYMMNKADTVITYITHDWGGAAKFAGKAKRKGKNMIHLSGANIDL